MWFFKKKKKKVTPPSYARGVSNNQPAVVDDMVTSALNPLNPLSPFWIGNNDRKTPSCEPAARNDSPEPHSDLKAAFARGQPIQSETTMWDGTHVEWVDQSDPQWYPHIRYRVKP